MPPSSPPRARCCTPTGPGERALDPRFPPSLSRSSHHARPPPSPFLATPVAARPRPPGCATLVVLAAPHHLPAPKATVAVLRPRHLPRTVAPTACWPRVTTVPRPHPVQPAPARCFPAPPWPCLCRDPRLHRSRPRPVPRHDRPALPWPSPYPSLSGRSLRHAPRRRLPLALPRFPSRSGDARDPAPASACKPHRPSGPLTKGPQPQNDYKKKEN